MQRRTGMCAWLGVLILASAVSVSASVVNVPADYSSIQAAIAAAANGDEIVVQPGTYHERLDFLGKAITVRGTSPATMAVTAATIIDGDAGGPVVSFNHNEQRDSVLSGVTLIDGSGFDTGAGVAGGGVYCMASSPTITQCLIRDNRAPWGAGIYSGSGNPLLTSNVIKRNKGTWGAGIAGSWSGATVQGNTLVENSARWGGGIHCNVSALTIVGNTVRANKTTDGGAGISCCAGNPTVIDNTVSGNASGFWGGGLAFTMQSRGTFISNRITDNTAVGKGGGVYSCDDSCPTFTGNIISDNRATGPEADGGGLCLNSGVVTLSGNRIYRNSATHAGGALYALDGTCTLTNDTIAYNSAAAGTIANSDGVLTLTSCIVAFGQAGSGIWHLAGTPPTVNYCDVYGNLPTDWVSGAGPGIGCLAQDPLFAKASAGDFRLRSTGGRWTGTAWVNDAVNSPCINAGDPAAPYGFEPAPNGSRINMGFDGNTPYASKSPAPAVVAFAPRGTQVSVLQPVTVSFSVQMNRHSVESAFGVLPAAAGSFSWSGRRVTFTPSAAWSAGRRYRFTIGSAATSAAGVRLGRDFTWSFAAAGGSVPTLTAAAVPTAAGAEIRLQLGADAAVTATVCNLAGRPIAVLQAAAMPRGANTLLWNGRASSGTAAPAGTYLVNVQAAAADGTVTRATATLRR